MSTHVDATRGKCCAHIQLHAQASEVLGCNGRLESLDYQTLPVAPNSKNDKALLFLTESSWCVDRITGKISQYNISAQEQQDTWPSLCSPIYASAHSLHDLNTTCTYQFLLFFPTNSLIINLTEFLSDIFLKIKYKCFIY